MKEFKCNSVMKTPLCAGQLKSSMKFTFKLTAPILDLNQGDCLPSDSLKTQSVMNFRNLYVI